MVKIVYNACYGGFSLSKKAIARYIELSGVSAEDFYDRDVARNDPTLAQVVEELGREADGDCAKLEIYEIAAGTKYYIDEYDGMEHIIEFDDFLWETA
jgi:hypothetical protein